MKPCNLYNIEIVLENNLQESNFEKLHEDNMILFYEKL